MLVQLSNRRLDVLAERGIELLLQFAGLADGDPQLPNVVRFADEGQLEEGGAEIADKLLRQQALRPVAHEVHDVLELALPRYVEVYLSDDRWPPRVTLHFRPDELLLLELEALAAAPPDKPRLRLRQRL